MGCWGRAQEPSARTRINDRLTPEGYVDWRRESRSRTVFSSKHSGGSLKITALLDFALQDSQPFKHEKTPDNLGLLFEKLQKTIAAGDDKTALALTHPLIPDEAALTKGLQDDVAPAAFAQALEFFTNAIPPDAKWGKLFKADSANTEAPVYASTTEDLVKDEKGSVAFNQFPGGAKKLAESVLRTGMTCYEVTLVKQGEPSGKKFHLCFWTGEKWAMLGPLWRAIK